jgi:hypothetical protein
MMVDEVHVKVARVAARVSADTGAGSEPGDVPDDGAGEVSAPAGTEPVGWGRFAAVANRRPAATAAIKTAATPTIR